MSDAATVDLAAAWADGLVRFESRGPGDLDGAMRRVARRTGLPHALFWRLRYRRPKDIFAAAFLALQSAYQAECERQHRRLAHDLELTKAVAGPDGAAQRAAEALVGALDGAPAAVLSKRRAP